MESADRIEALLVDLQQVEARITRLAAQARDISTWLAEFGIGPCPIPEGVKQLGHRAEQAEAQIAALREALVEKKATAYVHLDGCSVANPSQDYERGRHTGRAQVASELLALAAAPPPPEAER
jgi:hypothetical protein